MTTNLAQAQRAKNHRFMQRLMLGAFVGSGLFHGLALGLIYLRPAQVVAAKPPEPEMEILIEDMPPIDEQALVEEASDEAAQLAGSTGGDDVMEVATLSPAQAMQAEESLIPEAAPDEVTDTDLVNPTADPNPTEKPQPTGDSELNKDPNAIKGDRNQAGEKQGNLEGGSEKRGLAKETGKGAGSGNKAGGNGGEGQAGKSNTNEGGKNNQTVVVKKEEAKKEEAKKPEPKKEEPKKAEPKKPDAVAILPKPAPPKGEPKPRPKKSNFGYDRDASERVATGTKGRFSVEYDEKGRVKGGKLIGSTGDAELDAAQLRDFNRALESNRKLRDQLENRAPESRNKPVRFVFEGDGDNATERQQIQRNRDLTAQQDADRAAAQAAAREAPSNAARENPTPGGIVIPLPIDLPKVPAAAPVEPAAAPVEPAAAPIEPAAAPVEPAAPAYEPPAEPAPVEPAYEPPAEPAPVEPAYEPPVEPAPVEPAYEPPAEPAPVEPAYEPPAEPAPAEPAYEPPAEPAPAEPAAP